MFRGASDFQDIETSTRTERDPDGPVHKKVRFSGHRNMPSSLAPNCWKNVQSTVRFSGHRNEVDAVDGTGVLAVKLPSNCQDIETQ